MPVPSSAYAVVFEKFALTSTGKTAIFLVSDTKTPFCIPELSVSCSGTAGFLLVELVLGTNAGAGTAGETFTPLLIRGGIGEPRTTAKIKYSAEPTVLKPIKQWEFPMPGGPFTIQSPLGREPGTVSLTEATSGSRVGVRLTASSGAPEARGYVEFEE